MMPEIADVTIREYVARLAGEEAAPGGGSAAALCGALAAASARMVGSFTVGREKYADVESEMLEHLEAIDEITGQMLELAQEDMDAFGAVREAYALPKDSDEQKAERSAAIQQALVGAADVPMRLARACERVSQHLQPIAEKGNQNLVSDVGVAAKLCEAACECAWLNVEVNLAYIRNERFVDRTRAELQDLLTATRCACQQTWETVAAAITD